MAHGSVPGYSACGCGGQAVGYVTSGYANAPVKSATSCPVEDSGSPEEDSGTDATADAPTEAGATSEAGSDAEVDGAVDGGADASESSDGGDAGDAH